jgi:hypothetical protein
VECGVGVKVLMAIETSDSIALLGDLPILGLIELFLRKRREQQAQSFDLHGRENADGLRVVVADRQQLTAADVAEIRPILQKDRRRKLRRQMAG